MPRPTPPRVLVTGSTGWLGGYVLDALARDWPEAEVIGMSRRKDHRIPSVEIDLTDVDALVPALAEAAPTHILHLAAASKPDAFGNERNAHEMLNTETTRQLAYFADTTDAQLIFASSDFVFDGTAKKRYSETDRGRAIHPYGLSKLKAERHVLAYGKTVARLSLMHDPDNPDTPVSQLMRRARTTGEPISAAVDEVRTPLHFRCAARALVGLAQAQNSGIFHVCGPSAMSAATMFHAATGPEGAALITPVRRNTAQPDRPSDVGLKADRLARKFPHLLPKPLFPDQSGLKVVILVHNGANHLKQSLTSLARQTNLSDLGITVACNGCTDASAQIAATCAPMFKDAKSFDVMDMEGVGRNAALLRATAGDVGPVVVLDQDADLSPDALRAVQQKFDQGADYVALRAAIKRAPNPIVSGYHRTWSRLSYVRTSPATAGVYAARGWVIRGLGQAKPDTADDKYIRLSVIPERRALVGDEYYRTQPQRDVRQLVRDRARYDASHADIATHYLAPGHVEDVERWNKTDVALLLRHPVDGTCFAIIGVLSTFLRWKRQVIRRMGSA